MKNQNNRLVKYGTPLIKIKIPYEISVHRASKMILAAYNF